MRPNVDWVILQLAADPARRRLVMMMITMLVMTFKDIIIIMISLMIQLQPALPPIGGHDRGHIDGL